MKTSITCLECDHEHELEVHLGETRWDDYAVSPEVCEECGAEFSGPGVDERDAERRQMGITE